MSTYVSPDEKVQLNDAKPVIGVQAEADVNAMLVGGVSLRMSPSIYKL